MGHSVDPERFDEYTALLILVNNRGSVGSYGANGVFSKDFLPVRDTEILSHPCLLLATVRRLTEALCIEVVGSPGDSSGAGSVPAKTASICLDSAVIC